ncbi:MAG TPA: ABC transporter permease [Gemmatales bacterium]|nr:ABC transporter permease [Gemmatales bacterium]
MFVNLGHAIVFFARTAWHLPGALLRPNQWVPHWANALLGVLPLAAAAGLAMGIIAWLQLRNLLVPYGSVEALPRVLLLTVVWEFGPIAVAFVAAGRLGAGLAAELAALKESEQIDAAQVMGMRIIPRLIAPRVLGCILALPILTVFVDYLALAASFSAEALAGTMTWMEFARASLTYLHLLDTILSIAKTCIFGYLIACAGCYAGLRASGGAVAVGRAATQGVVRATLLVLVADVFLVKLIQLVVM